MASGVKFGTAVGADGADGDLDVGAASGVKFGTAVGADGD